MACQHFPDDQTLRLQAGAGEDDVIHLPSGLDRVDCERQEEEEAILSTEESQNMLQHGSSEGQEDSRQVSHKQVPGPPRPV